LIVIRCNFRLAFRRFSTFFLPSYHRRNRHWYVLCFVVQYLSFANIGVLLLYISAVLAIAVVSQSSSLLDRHPLQCSPSICRFSTFLFPSYHRRNRHWFVLCFAVRYLSFANIGVLLLFISADLAIVVASQSSFGGRLGTRRLLCLDGSAR
jgi:tryptophan-rich sensory protein